MELVEDLKAVKKLIEKPEHWIKGLSAVDGKGKVCVPDNPTACQFCLSGALTNVLAKDLRGIIYPKYFAIEKLLNQVTGEFFAEKLDAAIDEIIEEDGEDTDSFIMFNDYSETEHADVMKLLDIAIEKAKEL